MPDLGADVGGVGNVELVGRARVAHRELVERADPVPEPLARDEDRRAHVEAEGVVLERRPVPLAHQEADQALVGLVHLLAAPREADPRAVDDREVVGHRAVEPDEAVVEDADGVVGYHFGVVTATRASVAGAYVGTSGWSYPTWRGGFYPPMRARRTSSRHYAERLHVGRAEHERVPAPLRGALHRAGRSRYRPGSASRSNASPDHARLETRARRHLLRAGPAARRQARPGARRARPQARRRLPHAAAGLARPRASRSRSTFATSPGPAAAGAGARELARGRRAVPLPPPARAARTTRPRSPAGPRAYGPLLDEGVRVYCYFKHEDDPEAPCTRSGCWSCSRRSREPRARPYSRTP